MDARTVRIASISGPDLAAWRSLTRTSLEPNPFFGPDCLVPAARHLPGGADLRLIVAEEDGAFLAAMPVLRVPRWRREFPLPVLTTRGVYTAVGLGTPLVAPDRVGDAARTLLAGAVAEGARQRAGVLVLDWIGDDGPVAAALRDAAEALGHPVTTFESWERGLLVRGDAGDEWAAGISRERLRGLRRRQRRLAEELGGEVRLVDRAGDPAAVEEYMRLEMSGWKGTRGLALGRRAETAAWFRAVCDAFHGVGALQMLALDGGGRTIAMQCVLREREGALFFRIAHDDAFARFAPGVQVLVGAMSHLTRDPSVGWVDSCSEPDDAFTLDLFPATRRVATLMIALGDRRLDRILMRAAPGVRVTAKRVRAELRTRLPEPAKDMIRTLRSAPTAPLRRGR